jgi:hypothetical protein
MRSAGKAVLGGLVVAVVAAGLVIVQEWRADPGLRNRVAEEEAPASAGQTVRLSWFYKPPGSDSLLDLPRYFETFILTRNDEVERDLLKNLGAGGPFLQYLRFDAIQDPGSCSAQPYRNQVADRVGDFCWISVQHPDWFLLDAGGRRIVHDGYVMMDPGHAGWRAFWLARVRQSQEESGWDGVFLDNVEASLAKRRERGALPVKYPDEAGYQAAIEGFLAYIYGTYFRPQGRPLQANVIALDESGSPEVWFRYLQFLDGVMEERFAVDWLSAYLHPVGWESQLARIERAQALGKQVTLVSQGNRNDLERQQFALASYLLVSGDYARFRYSHHTAYRELWLYQNYGLDLGRPLGPRYYAGRAWRRDFERGQVWVDPVSHQAEIVVDGPVLHAGGGW